MRREHPRALSAALLGCACLIAAPPSATTAELKPKTVAAFDAYIRQVEARVDERVHGAKSFLWAAESPARLRSVRQGEIAIERRDKDPDVPDGKIHDWIGAVFIPGVTLAKTVALVEDYDNHEKYYQPEVMESRLLSRDGNRFRIHLRLLKKKVLTVVLNTEHDVRYFPLDGTRWHSRSYSTRIAEVADAGEPNERELPAGNDHGFLWRLYSYWRFQQKDGGVWVECEAVSLTRDIPFGLSWLIQPIVRDLPRESLARTLESTRDALAR